MTVGFIKEAYFISRVLKEVFYFKLFKGEKQDTELCFRIGPDATMVVWYQGKEIWKEVIDGPTSFFGVESCDAISRIISCIDNGTDWSQYVWKENLDIKPSSP